MKKLKCVKHNTRQKSNEFLTIGKIYDFDSTSEGRYMEDAYVGSYSSYYIKNDNNEYRYYDKECFIDIVEDRDNKLNQLGIC